MNGWYCESSSRLEERTASGQRTRVEERLEVREHVVGEAGGEEAPLDLVVVVRVQGEVQQVVLGQEAVEHVGGEHHRRRHADVHVGEAAAQLVQAEQPSHEGEARAPCRRASPPPMREEERRLGVERLAVEVADQRLRLLAAVLGDRVDQVVAQVLQTGEVRDLARAQAVGQRELGARGEPVGEVVPLGVVADALRRHRVQLRLERLEVGRAVHLAPVGQPEDEIAEGELLHHEAAQVVEHGVGEPLSRKGMPAACARAANSARPDWSRMGRSGSGRARHAGPARSRPRGSSSPPRGNSTSVMMPSRWSR